jgi:hypothetical protein
MKHIAQMIFVLCMLAHGFEARSQASVTSQVFAEVMEALAAQETQQLNFGRFSPETSGGQVVITPDGNRSAQGSVVLASGSHSPGMFFITGAPMASFSIQLPLEPAVLVHQSSNRIMVVDYWTSDPPSSAEVSTQADGSRQISIGATLLVGNMQSNPTGIYSGTFQVTFAYN